MYTKNNLQNPANHSNPFRYPNGMTLNFSQQAAAAIASNIAMTQVQSWLGLTSDKIADKNSFFDQLRQQLNALEQLYMHHKSKASTCPPITAELTDAQNKLEILWKTLASHQKDKEQTYQAPAEIHLTMASALILLEDIRNATSHGAFKKKSNNQTQRTNNRYNKKSKPKPKPQSPVDLCDQPSLCIWLEKLHRTALSSLNFIQKSSLWVNQKAYNASTKAENQEHWELSHSTGLPFFLSLFLTKSNLNWLAAQLLPTEQKTRLNQRLLSYYSWRDGVSLLAVNEQDQNTLLIREILGYLSLPPVDSAEGQTALQHIDQQKQQTKAEDPFEPNPFADAKTPTFRYERKTANYLMQLADKLNLMPELQFWGYWEINQGDAEQPDWQKATKDASASQSPEHKKLKHKKLVRNETYGRNTLTEIQAMGGTEKACFIYSTKNNNLRFQLLCPKQAAGTSDTPPQGVMRWRDFINWIYIAAIKEQQQNGQDQHQMICQAVAKELKARQELLDGVIKKTITPEKLTPEEEKWFKYLPEPVELYLKGETPDLKARIAKRLDFWEKQRLPELNKAFEPNIAWRKDKIAARRNHDKVEIPDDLMPIHQQAQEILHHLIAALNTEERKAFSQYKFQHLYNALLTYKRDQELFWTLLKEYFPSHPHLKWKSPAKPNKKFPNNKRSLHELMESVLQEKRTQIATDKAQLKEANQAQLEQIAARWQVGLGEDRREKPTDGTQLKPRYGWQGAAYNAEKYTVLKAGFVQWALDTQGHTHMQRNAAKPVNPEDKQNQWAANYAKAIREHSSSLALKPAFYQLKQREDWSTLNKSQKRKLIACLNDWHTEDKLCLLLAEKLAEQTQVPFAKQASEKQMSVDQAFDQKVIVPFKVPGQQDVYVYVEFQNVLQVKRQWALGKPEKIAKAIWHNYPKARDKTTPAAKAIQQLMQQYRSRYLELVTQILELEYQANKKDWFQPADFKEGKSKQYVPFEKVVNCLQAKAAWKKEACTKLKDLRNHALHDGVPNNENFYQPEPGKLRVTGLGETERQAIKKLLGEMRKN